MLNDLDETLKVLLQQELPRVMERIEAGGFDIRFEAPNREFRARLTRPTISLFLYNIQENRDLRGQVWQRSRSAGDRTDQPSHQVAADGQLAEITRYRLGHMRNLFQNGRRGHRQPVPDTAVRRR